MNVETQIKLKNAFTPREYQKPVIEAFEKRGIKKIVCIMPRRAGKDVMAFNLTLRAALRKVGVYYYLFPTYAQGKKVIWTSITNSGETFISYIPEELIASTNSQDMTIKLVNGSMIQIVGSENIDSLVGTNPQGCVFSEYAIQSPLAYQFLRPILTANGGWAMFLSTPRGKNHFWELYQIALQHPDWFAYKITLEDTNHVPLYEIERDLAEGIMSIDMVQQEYYTSFTMGVAGSYYAQYLDRMRLNNRIGQTPHETGFKVFTAWDIGVRDNTTIIFFQIIGQTIRIIDCYEKSKEGLEHYVKVLESKAHENGYVYGKHIAPHDMRVQEFGSGITRLEKARQLGLNFTMSNEVSILDGIEAVRSAFSKIWIDEVKCKQLIKALENYRQEWDDRKRVYKTFPLHDWSSHFADAMRYLCVSLPKTRDGASGEDIDKRYREAMYGSNSGLPEMFRSPADGGY